MYELASRELEGGHGDKAAKIREMPSPTEPRLLILETSGRVGCVDLDPVLTGTEQLARPRSERQRDDTRTTRPRARLHRSEHAELIEDRNRHVERSVHIARREPNVDGAGSSARHRRHRPDRDARRRGVDPHRSPHRRGIPCQVRSRHDDVIRAVGDRVSGTEAVPPIRARSLPDLPARSERGDGRSPSVRDADRRHRGLAHIRTDGRHVETPVTVRAEERRCRRDGNVRRSVVDGDADDGRGSSRGRRPGRPQRHGPVRLGGGVPRGRPSVGPVGVDPDRGPRRAAVTRAVERDGDHVGRRLRLDRHHAANMRTQGRRDDLHAGRVGERCPRQPEGEHGNGHDEPETTHGTRDPPPAS